MRSSRYANAIQDAIVTVRDGRFVVPVKAEFAGQVQGIVHDTSSSGQTLFVEPLETLEANNRLRQLRAQEEFEIARILAELSSMVQSEAAQIDTNVEVYVDVDLASARAALAHRMQAIAPELVDDAVLTIVDGRHPLLDERAVPQTVRLDDEVRILVVSGPNMGGKTVALKLVGLVVAMTACGMHVPAAAATDRALRARLYRHRRRAVDRAERLDVLRAPAASRGDRRRRERTHADPHRRDRQRHRAERRRRARGRGA